MTEFHFIREIRFLRIFAFFFCKKKTLTVIKGIHAGSKVAEGC